MTRAPAAGFRLGDGEIGGGHVLGLFDGADDMYMQLAPFVAEGLDRGQAAIHVVDPARRTEHLERLAASGIDVAAAGKQLQLEVLTWPDFYLIDGRFEHEQTERLLETVLAQGRVRGYAATRAIGFMEWALEVAPGVEAITTYEAILDVQLRRAGDVVICAYDVRRHRPAVIADVLDLHPYAVIEGRLRKRAARREPRDRILATAARLFHRNGVAATGIDRVIAEAGVAKMTLYRHYSSKEDLVLAWLRDPATRWFDRILEEASRNAQTAEELIPAIFDAIADWLERDGYRGCPYLHIIAELADAGSAHRVRAEAESYIGEIRDRLRQAAVSAGADGTTGDQLHALMAGAVELAAATRSTAPVPAAREGAIQLLPIRRRSSRQRSRRSATS